MVGDLIYTLQLSQHNPRFHFNPTGSSKYTLPLTINNRYIVAKARNLDEPTWWVIHPGLDCIGDEEPYETVTFAHKQQDLP